MKVQDYIDVFHVLFISLLWVRFPIRRPRVLHKLRHLLFSYMKKIKNIFTENISCFYYRLMRNTLKKHVKNQNDQFLK